MNRIIVYVKIQQRACGSKESYNNKNSIIYSNNKQIGCNPTGSMIEHNIK